MTLTNGSRNDIVRRRREMVGRLRVMGMTEHEITAALAKPGNNQILNPKTQQPYSRETVHNDLVILRQEWRDNAAVPTKEHQERELAEIQEVKRQAFLDRDGRLALSAIDQEMKLLGTAAPKELKITFDIEIVSRLWQTIERTGDDPAVVLTDFNRYIQDKHALND